MILLLFLSVVLLLQGFLKSSFTFTQVLFYKVLLLLLKYFLGELLLLLLKYNIKVFQSTLLLTNSIVITTGNPVK